MELKDFLQDGAQKAGTLTALGLLLGLSQPRMSNCKAHKEPLPLDAVVKLSDYIGADLKTVIAANELVTEKKEARRAFWRPFVSHARNLLIVGASASVVNLATPSPTEAAPLLNSTVRTLCIMLNRIKKAQLLRRIQLLLESLKSALTTRTFEPKPI